MLTIRVIINYVNLKTHVEKNNILFRDTSIHSKRSEKQWTIKLKIAEVTR